MRIARVTTGGTPSFAVLDDEHAHEIDGSPFGQDLSDGPPRLTGQSWPIDAVRLLAPVEPSKVVAVARNYADHAAETGSEVPAQPMIFLKPSTSVIGPGDAIVLPRQSERVDHEAELAVVIGTLCRDVRSADVSGYVFGVTAANDVTARDLQKTDGQWSRAKGFDTFCPLGPWIETDVDVTSQGQPQLDVACIVSGEVRQDGNTRDMVFSVAELIEWISAAMTLLPGDVILTGTPAGISPLKAGDEAVVKIERIGALANPVVLR